MVTTGAAWVNRGVWRVACAVAGLAVEPCVLVVLASWLRPVCPSTVRRDADVDLEFCATCRDGARVCHAAPADVTVCCGCDDADGFNHRCDSCPW